MKRQGSDDHLSSEDSSAAIVAAEQRLAMEVAKKDVLLEKLAVEMRTLISAALGMLELLQEARNQLGSAVTPAGAQENDYIRSLAKSLDMVNTMVNNTLDYARAESGRIVLDQSGAFNVESLVDELVASSVTVDTPNPIATVLSSDVSHVELSYEIADDVPAVLVGDKLVLSRILRHLVTNALKFTQHGSVHIQVSVSHKHQRSGYAMLRVRVLDTGRGIAQAHLKHLFTPFYTLRQTGSGTGLGLAVCHRLAALFPRGKLAVVSQLEKGTAITFRALFKLPSTGSIHSPCVSIRGGPHLPSAYILADPRKPLLRSLEGMLTRHSVRVIASVGSFAALHRLLQSDATNPNVVITSFSLVLIDCSAALLTDPAFPHAGKNNESLGSVAEEFMRAVETLKEFSLVLICFASQREFLRPLAQRARITFLTKPLRYEALMNSMRKASSGAMSALTPMTPQSVSPPAPQFLTFSSAVTGSERGSSSSTSEMAQVGDGKKPFRVLVAEDNPLMRHTLVKMIEGLQAQCSPSENGRACLDQYIASPGSYDVVLMDLQMPVMDGFESAKGIRQIDREQSRSRTAIVALTATDLADARGPDGKKKNQDEDSKLFDEIIIKPVTRKTLLDLFGRLTKQKDAEQKQTQGRNPEADKKSVSSAAISVSMAQKPVEVLLVEDNEMIAKITGKVLEQSGCKVSRARDGQEALAMLIEQSSKFELVLMDVLMPVMDGWTATRQWRLYEREHGLTPKPVVALSTNSQAAHRNACVEAGCTDFAAKPIDYPTLRALVHKHVPRTTQN